MIFTTDKIKMRLIRLIQMSLDSFLSLPNNTNDGDDGGSCVPRASQFYDKVQVGHQVYMGQRTIGGGTGKDHVFHFCLKERKIINKEVCRLDNKSVSSVFESLVPHYRQCLI